MSSALEQFVALAKTARGRACVALVQQVLNHPKIFVFGELLAMPNVQALAGTEHESTLRLLEIFAFGSYGDFVKQEADLPALSDAQRQKLLKLSVLRLAQSSSKISYEGLMEALHTANVRATEDVVIETIYAGLMDARLNQRERQLRVTSCIGRDVRFEEVPDIHAKLTRWKENTDRTIAALERLLADASALRESTAERVAKRQSDLDDAMGRAESGALAPEDDAAMDVDLDVRSRAGAARRRPRPAFDMGRGRK